MCHARGGAEHAVLSDAGGSTSLMFVNPARKNAGSWRDVLPACGD
jgi:hypothetical protein